MNPEPITTELELPANDDGTWTTYVYGFIDSEGRKVCAEVGCRGGFTGIVVEWVECFDEDGKAVEASADLRDAIAAEARKP